MKKIDLVGRVFGRLEVLAENPIRTKTKRIAWLCKCVCGNEVSVRGGDLQQGKVQSCGCYSREMITAVGKRSTHGMTNTPTWRSWESMRSRCCRTTDPSYALYGGRGITVCDSWLHSFENFLKDMGVRPEGTTLDRKNTNGNYEPNNCRWSTSRVQSNNKTNNVRLTYLGETRTVAEWSMYLQIPAHTIYSRIRKGLPTEQILSTDYRRRTHVKSN